MYVGSKTIYTNEEYFVVDMADINAIYYGKQGEESLSDEVMIEGVYVLNNVFQYAGKELKNVTEVKQLMGNPVYEGNAYVILPEAVAIHVLNQSGSNFYTEVIKDSEQILRDAIVINEYDDGYSLYIYTYVQEGLRYTFFGKDRNGKFAMYLIEKDID